MGVTAESAVTPTAIVALSRIMRSVLLQLIVIVNNLFRRKKKGHERPRLKIISAPKVENIKKGTKLLPIKSAVSM